MLDVGFNRFLSLTFVSIAWVVALALAGLGLLGCAFAGVWEITDDSTGIGVLTIVAGVVGSVLFVLFARLALETVAVLFRIAESTRVIAENARSVGSSRTGSYAYTPVGHVEYGPRRSS